MSDSTPFDNVQNPELVAMKKNIADRKFNLKVKGMIVTGLFAVAAIALLFFAPPALLAAAGPMAAPLLAGLAMAGSAVSGFLFMKEMERLEVDEKYLQSYMQGKNYWGKGYREEVCEYGYGGPRLALHNPDMGAIPGGPGAHRGQGV